MKRGLQRLEKLGRLREIARVQAMREAAGALGELARLQAVAQRAQQLGLADGASADGAALRDRFRFADALAGLREEARRSVNAADAAVGHAQATLTRRSRERDLVRERLDELRLIESREKPLPSPALARSLNSTSATSAAAQRPRRGTR